MIGHRAEYAQKLRATYGPWMAENEKMRRSFFAFVKGAWHTIVDSPMIGEAAIELECDYLEALYHGETRSLVLNLPPGVGKSTICSVLFPVWCWLQDPKLQILCASFGQNLCVRLGELTLRLLDSKWFKDRFPLRVKGARPAVTDFTLEQGGWRYATTPHGQVTGMHGDIRIVDDPIKPEDALADAKEIENVTRWFSDTWLSRARNVRTVRDLLVMQRLSEVDPSQYFIDMGATALILPARYEVGRFPDTITLPSGREMLTDYRSKNGEVLDRLDPKFLDGPQMTPYVYASQYQLRPSAEGTRIFQPEQLERTWTVLPSGGIWCMSVDAAFKAEATSDYVVIEVWCKDRADYYLIDQVRGRLSFTETCTAIEQMAKKWPKARAKLIEDKANGPAILDALSKRVSGLIGINPKGGKATRANAIQPLFAAKNVLLPVAPWVDAYRREMTLFPYGGHDDQVDATSQALVWLSERPQNIGAISSDVQAALLGMYDPNASTDPDAQVMGYQAWRASRAVPR